MTPETKSTGQPWLASGRLNTVVGWLMLILGLLATSALDPWYFSAETSADASDLPHSELRHMARHAQGVLLAMTLVQLAVGRLLSVSAFPAATQRLVALLILSGGVAYASGYLFALYWGHAGWVVLAGSLLNLAGFAACLVVGPTGKYATRIRIVLVAACFGMLLDFVAGLFVVVPADVPSNLGGYDEIRMRMLRLARVAAIALSVLALLYAGLPVAESQQARWQRIGERALVAGAVGMPAILAAACFVSLHLKYLLPIPATAVLLGVAMGTVQARRAACRLEFFGWLMILVSLSIGMLMGMYAFAGPLPTPAALGDYVELARQRSILAHSYAVVFGIVAIFVARRFATDLSSSRAAKFGIGLLIGGSLVSVAVLIAGVSMPIPAAAHALGPLASCLAIVLCLIASFQSRPE